MAKAFSDTMIRSLKAPVKRIEMGDNGQGSVGGLFLILQPSGALSWAFRYRSPVHRNANGQPAAKKLTLSTKCDRQKPRIADARAEALQAKGMVRDGLDPIDQKNEEKAASIDRLNTIGGQLDVFLERHVCANNKPSTATEVQRIIETYLRPRWGRKRLTQLMRRDVIELLDELVDDGKGTMANRVFATVRKFGNWLVERGAISTSFAAGVRAPAKERTRDRVLGDMEIRLLWKATEKIDIFNCLVRVALLTGARRGEVAGMAASELHENSNGPFWVIPAVRTKTSTEHVVPISAAIKAEIDRVPKVQKSKLVFSTTGNSAFSGFARAKRRLDRTMLEIAQQDALMSGDAADTVVIKPWTLHDLRRTCASGLAKVGTPVHVTEAVLNHKSGTFAGIVTVYQRHDYADEKRRALSAWSAYVADLLNESTASNVVNLRSSTI